MAINNGMIYYPIANSKYVEESERTYTPIEARVTQTRERSYGYPENVSVDLDLYLDEQTGLVVWDVYRYEEWLEAIHTRTKED